LLVLESEASGSLYRFPSLVVEWDDDDEEGGGGYLLLRRLAADWEDGDDIEEEKACKPVGIHACRSDFRVTGGGMLRSWSMSTAMIVCGQGSRQ
jgi:hypothetical protein